MFTSQNFSPSENSLTDSSEIYFLFQLYIITLHFVNLYIITLYTKILPPCSNLYNVQAEFPGSYGFSIKEPNLSDPCLSVATCLSFLHSLMPPHLSLEA